MQVSSLRDAVWISRSMLIWQDHRDATMRRMGPVPTIGPRKVKGSTSSKNSIGNAASMNQKMKNMNTVLGRV
jgi:hypothetical protein